MCRRTKCTNELSFEDFCRLMLEHAEEDAKEDDSLSTPEDTSDLASSLLAMGFPADLVRVVVEERSQEQEVSLEEVVDRLRELQVT